MSHLQGEEAFKILLDELKDALREQVLVERTVADLRSKLIAINDHAAKAERLQAEAEHKRAEVQRKLSIAYDLWAAASDFVRTNAGPHTADLHAIVKKADNDLGEIPF